jgi:hypothetical protein
VTFEIWFVFNTLSRELKDGPKNIWRSEVILKYIDKIMSEKGYKYILTFDDYGVSGHINHCSISLSLSGR